ncbi:MAG: S9 family peptidase [Bryobacter sp.]|nr:S9 family peptidase [Bryobacter sp.]
MRLSLLVFAATVSLSAQAPAKRLLSLDDQFKFVDVGSPVCSPDGQTIAYTLSTTDVEKDKRDTDIWTISADGQTNLRLTSSPESESSPQFSPDGRYLAFLSSRPGPDAKVKGTQIWLLDRRGGEAKQITAFKQSLASFEWMPDSKGFLLIMKEKDADADKDPKDAKPKPIVINRYAFKRDGQGYIHGPHRNRIYLYDLEAKKPELVTTENFDESDAQFSPDGKQIVFVSKRGPGDPDRGNNSDIWVVDAKPNSTPRRLTSFAGNDSSPTWSPDGKYIAYTQGSLPAGGAYVMPRLMVVPAAGGEPKMLSAALDRGVSSPRFTADSRAVDFLVTDDRSVWLGRVPVGGGTIEKVLTGKRTFSSIERNNKCTVMLAGTAVNTPEVHLLEGGLVKKLTTHNDKLLGELNLATVEEVGFKAADGNEVHALLFKPHGYMAGTKVPALLNIHGGPNGQDQHSFSFERQLLAAQGYAVLAVNYRGSAGRGQAYGNIISADWGNKEVVDLLAGADYLVNSGLADPERLGVGGWSYGGILTDYLIASTTRFKAAISGAGTAFTVSYYGADQYILQYDNEIGPPWKNFDKYMKLGYPFLHADRIKTPTLFLCGQQDFNVPVAGSEQMYMALKSLGVPTELIVYPGEFHGIRRPSFAKDRLQRYLDWYKKYLGTPASSVSQ